jgi:RNA polymerase sigma factor (sigma-70 family)
VTAADAVERLASEPRWARLAASHCRPGVEPEDVLQRAFEITLTKLPEGLTTHQIASWFCTVVKREAWHHRRSCGLGAHDRLDPQATNGRSAEDSLVGTMETIDLFNALRRLRSDSERAALVDRMAGYTFKEIARRRGWTYTKVERCIREGREKVQGLMSDAASGAAVGS